MEGIDGTAAGTGGPTGITVTGTGIVAVEPDVATLRVGVSLADRELERARAQASAKVTAARDHLRDRGVADGDLRTAHLSVHTSHDRSLGRPTHHVSTTLAAILRDLTVAETIVDGLFAAVGEGMDLHGLEFGIADPGPANDEAMALAVADARAKAARLAELAGIGLGPVLAIDEAREAGRPAPGVRRTMAIAEDSSIPVEGGRIETRVTVTVRWAIAESTGAG